MIQRARSYLAGGGLGPSVVKAISGSAGVSILGMGFTFLLGWQLARGLGAAGYGIYGFAMAVVSILGVPSQFGLPQLLTREVAAANATQDWPKLKGVTRWAGRTAATSSLVIALGLWAWVVFAGPGFSSELGRSLGIGALLIPVIAFVALAGATLRGLLLVVMGQIPDSLVRPAAHSLLLVAMFVLGVTLTPSSAMGAGIAAAACALLVGVMLVIRHKPVDLSVVAPGTNAGEWRRASLPMALTEGLRVVQGQAAILALGAMVSMAEVGQFRVATSLMALFVLPLTVFNLVAAPHISRLSAIGEKDRLRRLLAYVSLGMTISVLALLLPFAVAGQWLVTIVFGREFETSSSILLVLAIGMLANAAFGVGATALNMLGYPGRVARASAWSVLTLCLLLWPGIMVAGAMGAAAVVSLAMALWGGLLWRDTLRLTEMDIGTWAFLGLRSTAVGSEMP